MNHWTVTKLKDISLKITKGTTPTTLGFPFVDKGINYIKSESITNSGIIDDSKFVYIDKVTHEKLNRSQLLVNDILISIAGIYLGKTAIVKTKYLPANTNQAVGIIRLNHKVANPYFIHYYLQTPTSRHRLNSLCAQSAQPNINLTQLGEFPINKPSLETQSNIASILSAYDDLIENNTRRIQILEQMAQTIYKEWFVNFRFPGHENTKFVDSTLGKIPEGWEVKKMENIADLTSSKRIYASEYVTEGVPFFRSKEIIELHNKNEISLELFISTEKYEEIKTRFGIPQIGDILITAVGTLGIPYRINTNENFYFKDGNLLWFRNIQNNCSIYLYYWLLSDQGRNELFKTVIGSSQPAFTIINLKQILLVCPSSEILNMFIEIFSAITNQLEKLTKKNSNLRRTRDLLLPKLMSGEVEV